ncbi:MAG: NAD(P)-dependent alcohol dehydrogenase [Christensenellales bacterium]
MKNLQALLVAKQKFEIREVEMPKIREDEVLVRIKHVGVCGSDVHFFESGQRRGQDLPFPVGLGHECAGVVVETGSKVKNVAVGDKVALEPGVTCGKCKFCLGGHYNLCPDVDFLAAPPNYKGAIVQYMSHPAHLAFKLPDNVSTMEGALVEPLAVGFNSALRAGAGFGHKVIILGVGCIGMTTLIACNYLGVPNIVVSDIFDNRLQMAKSFGATKIVNTRNKDAVAELTEAMGGLADIVFECAGTKFTAATTPYLVERGGKIIFVGVQSVPFEFDFFPMMMKEADLLTIFRYHGIYPGIIDALSSKKFNIESIVTKVFDFEHTQEAFDSAIEDKQNTIKNVIQID